MAAESGGGNAEGPARHVYGPRPIGALVPMVTRQAFHRQGAVAARLVADWPVIVGPAIAAVTLPRKFSGGTLAIACAGPIALELQHHATELSSRINAYFGREAVRRLRFLQEPVALAAPPLPRAAPRPAAPFVAVDLPDGALRDALLSLGATLLTER